MLGEILPSQCGSFVVDEESSEFDGWFAVRCGLVEGIDDIVLGSRYVGPEVKSEGILSELCINILLVSMTYGD